MTEKSLRNGIKSAFVCVCVHIIIHLVKHFRILGKNEKFQNDVFYCKN